MSGMTKVVDVRGRAKDFCNAWLNENHKGHCVETLMDVYPDGVFITVPVYQEVTAVEVTLTPENYTDEEALEKALLKALDELRASDWEPAE